METFIDALVGIGLAVGVAAVLESKGTWQRLAHSLNNLFGLSHPNDCSCGGLPKPQR